jgi:CheY-like chemotaxis protein
MSRMASQRKSPAVSTAAAEPMGPLRVLVVEDDVLIGMLLAETLASMGHDVRAIASTEADAVEAAVRCRPHLMIVDVGLSDGNGVSAVEAILRSGPVPHVFVTGDTSRIQALGPDAVVIEKPFCEADLARAIQRALGATSPQL